ncbi:hypothetical protein LNP74_00425 [Klebsiella pneumoniae subsp. pneumoniae]|nr:hypothetical protein [Klebsiella pneumoniae subsp. pneumoniae]
MLNFVKETRESGFFYAYHLPRWRTLARSEPRQPTPSGYRGSVNSDE